MTTSIAFFLSFIPACILSVVLVRASRRRVADAEAINQSLREDLEKKKLILIASERARFEAQYHREIPLADQEMFNRYVEAVRLDNFVGIYGQYCQSLKRG